MTAMSARRYRNLFLRMEGFTLLEVLIAVVVLSIGLLGLAALQFSALRGNNQSYERSQAHTLAYEIADAMRANRVQAAAGAFNIGVATVPALPATDCNAAACSAAEAAAFALATWHQRMRILLPNSTARIVCSRAPCVPSVIHAIFVVWDENRTALDRTNAVASACPVGAAFNPALHLSCVQVTISP